MSFTLKKIISSLMMPLPISIFLLLIGVLLICFTHFRRTGIFSLLFALLVLLLFSTYYFPHFLVTQLESRYPPLVQAPKGVNTIVVLGAGVGGSKQYPANTRLDAASLSRLIEGVRLYRQLQEKGISARLILSGGRVFGVATTTARDLRNTALVLGVTPKDMLIENGSADTYEEALYLKPLLKGQAFMLVTSATHMPRAMALFQKVGLDPIAAPTGFISKKARRPFYYLPNSNNLTNSSIALHEYLGLLWSKWIGII
jgi:uncharacterized SAM-binding protein YcdF (DUF218 family)